MEYLLGSSPSSMGTESVIISNPTTSPFFVLLTGIVCLSHDFWQFCQGHGQCTVAMPVIRMITSLPETARPLRSETSKGHFQLRRLIRKKNANNFTLFKKTSRLKSSLILNGSIFLSSRKVTIGGWKDCLSSLYIIHTPV
jgi:hypothetical protein